MDFIHLVFGEGTAIGPLQMGCRALVMFVITIVLIRISGRRSFGMKSPFDNTITILLGAVLSRAVVGASPFLSTVAAALVLVVLHRGVAWACRRYPRLELMIKGHETILFKDGKMLDRNMDRALISESELMAAVRNQGHEAELENIEKAYLEANGRMSIILKPDSEKKPIVTSDEEL